MASRQYDAIGNVAAVSGTWTGPLGFAGSWGYQEDGDSGLQLLGHRYYDPSTGRFLTRDPIKDGRNWYTNCENNPLTAVDPDGLQSIVFDPVNVPQKFDFNPPPGGWVQYKPIKWELPSKVPPRLYPPEWPGNVPPTDYSRPGPGSFDGQGWSLKEKLGGLALLYRFELRFGRDYSIYAEPALTGKGTYLPKAIKFEGALQIGIRKRYLW
ncbi:MAG: RHS repeat-associated core domain-containing protein [Fimbriimonadaceae bacterium]|nr:RHS repeat-associated core domain-containing protein [Fimbriimonadaceae bacterium]